MERDNRRTTLKPKSVRGRTLSPVPSSRQVPSMSTVHKHLRRQSSSSEHSAKDGFIDPTYPYVKDRKNFSQSPPSKPSSYREPSFNLYPSKSNPQTTERKPGVLNPVDFGEQYEMKQEKATSAVVKESTRDILDHQRDEVPIVSHTGIYTTAKKESAPYSFVSEKIKTDSSIHSFNESIDIAHYPSFYPGQFDRKVFSTESMDDSNFSITLGKPGIDEGDPSCSKEDGGKPENEEGLHTFFKEKIQSQNPDLFITINKILEEEQDEEPESNDHPNDDEGASIVPPKGDTESGHEGGNNAAKSANTPSESSSAYVDSNHCLSTSSLNLSEPSLLETSTDNSPMPNIAATKAFRVNAESSEPNKSQSFHRETTSSQVNVSTSTEKDTSLHCRAQSHAAMPSRRRSISTERVDMVWNSPKHVRRSSFSTEQSDGGGMKRAESFRELTKQEVMAFASFESNARMRSESKRQTSFDAKVDAAVTENVEQSVPKVSQSMIDHMVRRLSTCSVGSGESAPKVMVLKDLMKYYSDKDNNSDSTKSTTASKTRVTNLHWKGIGIYTGQVNEKIEPHGDGKLLMFNGALLQGRWANGCPVSHDGPIEADDEKDATSAQSVANKEATTPAERVEESERRPSPVKKTARHDERSYKIGDEGRRRDMIKDKDKDVALMRIASLQPDDAAFIRRTDGTWTFSRVKKVTSDTIYFIVNSSGSTKSYNAKYWHSHVRTCKIPAERVQPKKLTRRLSSNELSDSEVSVPRPMVNHSLPRELPNKSKSPPKTYEIGKVREYDATKNRFSVKNLKPASAIDNSESSRDTTTLDGSTGKILPPPPATGNLRRGRFSFHGDGQYVSRKRSVSFSPARQESTFPVKDAPDDSPDVTEDEDDNFDVNGAISQRGYSLRGIEP
eukprot:CCRYP_003063-RB/>CCRYP_003063-RB protein AED:0.02 eAED:0.02 QI:2388/1/1/1/1/1/2/113/898